MELRYYLSERFRCSWSFLLFCKRRTERLQHDRYKWKIPRTGHPFKSILLDVSAVLGKVSEEVLGVQAQMRGRVPPIWVNHSRKNLREKHQMKTWRVVISGTWGWLSTNPPPPGRDPSASFVIQTDAAMTGIVSELSSPTIDSVYLSLGLLAVLSTLESSQQDWESDVTVQMVKG